MFAKTYYDSRPGTNRDRKTVNPTFAEIFRRGEALYEKWRQDALNSSPYYRSATVATAAICEAISCCTQDEISESDLEVFRDGLFACVRAEQDLMDKRGEHFRASSETTARFAKLTDAELGQIEAMQETNLEAIRGCTDVEEVIRLSREGVEQAEAILDAAAKRIP